MRAIVADKFGPPDVLEEKEIEKPVIEDTEVLIKTHTTTINTPDIFYRQGMVVIFGLSRLAAGILKPKKKVLGFDVAGEIVEVGRNISDFKVGDKVYGGAKSGANAEFTKADANKIAMVPDNVTLTNAGVMPMAGLTALQGLREAPIQKGQKVLIYGAAGGNGTYAVQLAKIYGATVTAVASGKNESLLKSIGADFFIDYTKGDFTKKAEKYDVIFDAVGKFPLSKWKKGLKEDGIYINAGNPHMHLMTMYLLQFWNRFRNKKCKLFNTYYDKKDLETLIQFYADGKLKSVIDKTYPLEKISEAHAYYEKRHTAGKIAITVMNNSS